MLFLKKLIWNIYLTREGTNSKFQIIRMMDLDEYEIEQKSNLDSLLLHLNEKVPFYESLIKDVSFCYSNFKMLPIMDKSDVRANFELLCSSDKEVRCPYTNSSGGSTGEPLKFIQDKEHAIWGRAVKSLYDLWSGLEPCDKQLRLWGSERDVFGKGNTIKQKLVRWIKNERWVNTFILSDKSLEKIIELIKNNNYRQITAYVDTAYELSKYINHNNIKLNFKGNIITSAGTLYPYMKNEIGQAFGCKVYNRYGSREVGDIACTFYDNDNLIVFTPVHFVEVLDAKLEPVLEGEIGEIYVTTLKNFSMPLVRYRIGDIGKVLSYNSNGSVRELASVEGRNTELLIAKNNEKVLPAYFIHMFGVVEKSFGISKIQFEQVTLDLFVINVVFGETLKEDEYNDFYEMSLNIIRKVIGDVSVEVNVLSDIPKSNSGKFRYVISHIER